MIKIAIGKSELKNSDFTFYEYYDGVYIPKNLNECLSQLDKILDDSTKAEALKMTEKEFTTNSHFGLGLWIRHSWGLWSHFRLSKYFNDLGIIHPDDMSSIILTSYYRKLNQLDIKLEEQVDYFKKYWKLKK